MSDQPKMILFAEGLSDAQVMRAALVKVALGTSVQVYPARDTPRWDGWEAALKGYLGLDTDVSPSRSLLLVDLDDSPTAAEAGRRVAKLADSWRKKIPEDCLVFAGLPGDETLRRWELRKFSLDDHVLKLVCDPAVYGGLEKKEEGRIKEPYDRVFEKLGRFKEVLDGQGMGLGESKRYLELVRALSGLVLGPGAFAQRVIEASTSEQGEAAFASILKPIRQRLA